MAGCAGGCLAIRPAKLLCALRLGHIQPDVWRGRPLCMAQFGRLFGTARVPHADRDVMLVAQQPTHAVVLCRNQFYFFDALWDSGEVGITEDQVHHPDIFSSTTPLVRRQLLKVCPSGQILRNLELILADAAEATDEAELAMRAVGTLTTQPRHAWAVDRAALEAVEGNKELLDAVDSALFVVCLDVSATAVGRGRALPLRVFRHSGASSLRRIPWALSVAGGSCVIRGGGAGSGPA
jgi:carnitine O-acetyltransferase